MRISQGVLVTFLLLSLARPAVGAGTLTIDAPGGLWRERDGSLRAAGAAGKQLVATVDGYEITAQSLHYDQNKQTGEAQGNVRWRDLRSAETTREIRADSIAFALAAKTVRAEGKIVARDGQVELRADLAQVDLAKSHYLLTGDQAQAVNGPNQFSADRLIYAGDTRRLSAEGDALWRSQSGEETRSVQAAKLEYDLAAKSGTAAGGVKMTAQEFQAVSERLSYEESSDCLTLTGQPVLTRGDFKLTAANIAWQPAQNLVTATGGTSFSDGSSTGGGDELRYETKENRVRLIGAARLVRGQDTLLGEEILYNLGTGEVSVTGRARAVISLEG